MSEKRIDSNPPGAIRLHHVILRRPGPGVLRVIADQFARFSPNTVQLSPRYAPECGQDGRTTKGEDLWRRLPACLNSKLNSIGARELSASWWAKAHPHME